MPIEIRQRTEEELDAYRITSDNSVWRMKRRLDPESTREWLSRHEMDRDVAAFEDGQMVGTSGAYSVPHNRARRRLRFRSPPMTDVTVLPTHNRRGIGTMLMRDQLGTHSGTAGRRGLLFWSSESIIYGRWGYGMAVQHDAVSIDTRHSRFEHQVTPRGNMRMVDIDEGRRIFPGRVETCDAQMARFYGSKAGVPLPDAPRPKSRSWPRRRLLCSKPSTSKAGSADGYVMYRVLPESKERRMKVLELVPTTDEAHAALWRFCFDMDLIWQSFVRPICRSTIRSGGCSQTRGG